MSDGKHTAERPFVAVEGQSFSCHQDWVNRATRRLTSHPSFNNTEHGETKGWRGEHFTALCFDQAGRRMRNGGDFMRATKEGTYPVWWIWPDQIVALLAATPDLLATLTGLIDRDLTFDGSRIIIPMASHESAIETVRAARSAILRATGQGA